jgi:hypothetical protein
LDNHLGSHPRKRKRKKCYTREREAFMGGLHSVTWCSGEGRPRRSSSYVINLLSTPCTHTRRPQKKGREVLQKKKKKCYVLAAEEEEEEVLHGAHATTSQRTAG